MRLKFDIGLLNILHTGQRKINKNVRNYRTEDAGMQTLDKRRKTWYFILLNYERKMKMEKFVPFEKLSKKKQKELNARKRGSWNGINPVTRRPENVKAYNRKKARNWSDDSVSVPFV